MADIKALLVLLLNGVNKLFFNELALNFKWHISRADCQEIHLGASIHSPGHFFFNIKVHLQRLLERHLSILAFFGITATTWTTFGFHLDAFAFWFLGGALPVD